MARNQVRPADKTYLAANGHMMTVSPTFSKFSGWYFVYSHASHAGRCWCYNSDESNYDVGEYAGEEE